MRRVVQISVVALLVLAAVAAHAARAWRESHRLLPEQAARIPAQLAAFPLRTENPVFVGERDVLDPEIVAKSGAEHYVAIDYRDEEGGAVRLHIGAAARSDAWLHEPVVCLPAQGWTSGEETAAPLWKGLPGADPEARIRRLSLSRPGQRLLVYYWYLYGDRIIASRAERRRIRFLDLLAGEREHAALIVIFYAPIETDEQASAERIGALARALWPHLSTILTAGG